MLIGITNYIIIIVFDCKIINHCKTYTIMYVHMQLCKHVNTHVLYVHAYVHMYYVAMYICMYAL